MSILVEFTSFLSGALSEYAMRQRWGYGKIFLYASLVPFLVFCGYVFLFPSRRGILVGVSVAVLIGVWGGIATVVAIKLGRVWQSRRRK